MIYGRDLIIRKVEKPATKLENGDYVEEPGEWAKPILADAVPNGKASTIQLPDGKRSQYSYEIVLDIDTEPFEYGDRVLLLTNGQAPMKLTDAHGNILFDKDDLPILMQYAKEYTVLGYHRYSFQAKLWL